MTDRTKTICPLIFDRGGIKNVYSKSRSLRRADHGDMQLHIVINVLRWNTTTKRKLGILKRYLFIYHTNVQIKHDTQHFSLWIDIFKRCLFSFVFSGGLLSKKLLISTIALKIVAGVFSAFSIYDLGFWKQSRASRGVILTCVSSTSSSSSSLGSSGLIIEWTISSSTLLYTEITSRSTLTKSSALSFFQFS